MPKLTTGRAMAAVGVVALDLGLARAFWADGTSHEVVGVAEPGFAAEVAAACADSGLPPGRLIVEITESTVVGGGATRANLEALRGQGVRISLDDFGTGSSSLSALAGLPVDQIKLDRSFVDSDAIAGAVLHLARSLGVEAVAEGVETPEQADRLHAMGYERAQGYLFGRPAAALSPLSAR